VETRQQRAKPHLVQQLPRPCSRERKGTRRACHKVFGVQFRYERRMTMGNPSWKQIQRELDRIVKIALVSGFAYFAWQVVTALPAMMHGQVY
jgi:hypothetical protein